MYMSSGSDSRQRTAVIPVRLTPSERDAIKEKAKDSGVTASEFMRCASLGKKTRSTIDSTMINELRRQGGSLRDKLSSIDGQANKEVALATIAAFREVVKTIEGFAFKRGEEEEK
jgi:hypothetical protein